MRKLKDSDVDTHCGLPPAKGPLEKSGPGALLAAAMSQGFMAPPKRSRPVQAGADGQSGAAAKRRRVTKVDAGQHGELDSTPVPKSRFLGVHWNKCKKKWRVRIKIAGRDTHVGYFAEEAEAALAFDRAIQKHNPNWQKDPASASLNFPERAGEDWDSPGPHPRRWGSAVAQWASADLVMARTQPGAVTPDCTTASWARSSSVGSEMGTPGKAKITPFHAKVMVASHHPIPSRSYYPACFNVYSSGSDATGQSRSALSIFGKGNGEMGRPVSKTLDLRDLAEACSAHESLSSSPNLHTLAALRDGPHDNDEAAPARLGSSFLGSSCLASQGGKLPSPTSLLSTCSTPAMPVTHAKEDAKPVSLAPPMLCEGIELEALKGLVALADASAQCSRSKFSPVDSFSGFGTPPTPSSQSNASDSDMSRAYSFTSSAGNKKKVKTPVKTPVSYESSVRILASHASTPVPISTPGTVLSGTAWAGLMQDSASSPHGSANATCANSGVDSKAVPTAFKRIAKPQNQRQQQQQQTHLHHSVHGASMHPHVSGPASGGGSSCLDGEGARRAPTREASTCSRSHQSFRGVTWDKMKKMWRVRVCLAGGGREHVGYFLDEKEGALAYLRAVERIKQGTYVSSSNKELLPKEIKVSPSGIAAAAAAAAACGQLGLLTTQG